MFALTFIMEYLTLWPKFFFDILSLVGLNPLGVDVYLRTLMAIDAEVVDRNIMHSPEVRRRKCLEVQVQTLVLGPGTDAEPDPSLDARPGPGPGSRRWCLSKHMCCTRSGPKSRSKCWCRFRVQRSWSRHWCWTRSRAQAQV